MKLLLTAYVIITGTLLIIFITPPLLLGIVLGWLSTALRVTDESIAHVLRDITSAWLNHASAIKQRLK